MRLILDSTEVTLKKALADSAIAKVAFVDEIDELVRLFDGNIAGVIWRRCMQEGMRSWLDTLPVDQLHRRCLLGTQKPLIDRANFI